MSSRLSFLLFVSLIVCLHESFCQVLSTTCGEETFIEENKFEFTKSSCSQSKPESTSLSSGRYTCEKGPLAGSPVCVSNISYASSPPVGGDYRPHPPRFGEYDYLSPTRWMHSLQLGGVVFLYHPCVAEEDKEELKMFAKSCLFQHIVTPYLLPSPEHLAVVVHGCVFYMNEVNWIALTDWIKDNALPPNQTALEGIHQWFEDGLLVPSEQLGFRKREYLCSRLEVLAINMTLEAGVPVISSDSHSNRHDQSTQSYSEHGETVPLVNDTDINNVNVTKVFHQYEDSPVLLILFFLFVVFVILFVAGVVISVYLQRKHKWFGGPGNRKRKYKWFGKLFAGNTEIGGTYIPPAGRPKVPGEEKRKLLDSDEEEV